MKGHITSRYPHNALSCRVILESKGIYISGEERRKKAHLARYSCTITLVRETAGVVSGRCGSNVYVCPHMENAIAVLSQIEEMILKKTHIDGRTINFTQ